MKQSATDKRPWYTPLLYCQYRDKGNDPETGLDCIGVVVTALRMRGILLERSDFTKGTDRFWTVGFSVEDAEELDIIVSDPLEFGGGTHIELVTSIGGPGLGTTISAGETHGVFSRTLRSITRVISVHRVKRVAKC